MASRRSYGSGRLYIRRDGTGRETFYGTFYAGGRKVNRRLGLKRPPGGREGLTQPQAEAALRQAMRLAVPTRGIGAELVTVEEAAARYIAHAKRQGRKRSTLENIESETRVHLAPFFRGRSLDAITHADVRDCWRRWKASGCRRSRSGT